MADNIDINVNGEIIPLEDIVWDDQIKCGVSHFREVRRGAFRNYEFALKVLKPDITKEDCKVDYWIQLDNEFIVKLFSVRKLKDELVLITAFCNKGTLHDLIRDRFPTGLNSHYYRLLMECIYGSLSYLGGMNPPLLNRHITPSKIYLHEYPDKRKTKVFQLNGFYNVCEKPLEGENPWTSEDYVPGTGLDVPYWHPRVVDQYLGSSAEVTQSDKTYLDLASAGIVFYEGATGQHPIKTKPYSSKEEHLNFIWSAFLVKRSGVLSMVQEESDDGTCTWSQSENFPEGMLLSSDTNLMNELKSLIANLLEVKQDKIWKFDKFQEICDHILAEYL